MNKKYRIVSPIRFFTFICIVVMLFTFIVLGSLSGDAHAASADTFRKVVIDTDDTIWSIASQYCDNDTDIRDYVREIIDLNEISAGSIRDGDIIYVPIYS